MIITILFHYFRFIEENSEIKKQVFKTELYRFIGFIFCQNFTHVFEQCYF